MSRVDGVVWDLFLELKNQLKALESRLTEYQKLLDGRWFESIKALAALDERLTDLEDIDLLVASLKTLDARITDLEDRVTENGG